MRKGSRPIRYADTGPYCPVCWAFCPGMIEAHDRWCWVKRLWRAFLLGAHYAGRRKGDGIDG